MRFQKQRRGTAAALQRTDIADGAIRFSKFPLASSQRNGMGKSKVHYVDFRIILNGA